MMDLAGVVPLLLYPSSMGVSDLAGVCLGVWPGVCAGVLLGEVNGVQRGVEKQGVRRRVAK